MSISGMKDELYALERFYEHSSMDKPVDLVVALRKAIQDIEKYHEREARTKKPPVKSYCGGVPNYCTPVDAVNMSQERVDETAKGEHDLWIAAACLKSTVEAAIKAGDWKVDGACDPTMDLQYLANCFSSIQNRDWVGLTDEEKEQATGWSVEHIEAKLKEENS